MLQKHRILSRSIVIDRVNERIEQIRFDSHKKNLLKIGGRTLPTQSLSAATSQQAEYFTRLGRYKRSQSYVRNLFDGRTIENERLVRKMLQIDNRQNPFQSTGKSLPTLVKKACSEDKKLHEQNCRIVERIVEKRTIKTKQQIAQECKVYEKYRNNLRKIKGRHSQKFRLNLFR